MNQTNGFINKYINNVKPFWLFFIVLVIITLAMIYWCGPTSTYAGYDYFFHLQRFNALVDTLRDGEYPIYIDYTLIDNYGYLTKIFYPDLILVPFAILALISNTFFAYEIMIFTMTILCGVFTYKTVKFISKSDFIAFISALLYTFSAYRLYDWYDRAALGEALSFTFLPIIFLGLYHIIKGDYRKWYILSIGYSLLIYTHVISSVLMFITLIIILLFYYKSMIKEPKRIGYLVVAGLVTIIIAGHFLFPLIEQLLSNTFTYESNTTDKIGYRKLRIDLVLWGLISGAAYPQNVLNAGPGILLTIIILFRLFVKGKSPLLRCADILTLIGIFYIILSSEYIPWGRYPFKLLGFIQFPWRFYEFTTFLFAFSGSYYLFLLSKRKKPIIVSVLLLVPLTIYIHAQHFKSLDFIAKSSKVSIKPSIDNEYHLIGIEYLPLKAPTIWALHDRGDSIISKYNETKIYDFEKKNRTTSFFVETNKLDSLELPLVYYKGYAAYSNNDEIEVLESANGLVKIGIDHPSHIRVLYKGTIIQYISGYLSIISTIILCIYIYLFKKRENDLKLPSIKYEIIIDK